MGIAKTTLSSSTKKTVFSITKTVKFAPSTSSICENSMSEEYNRHSHQQGSLFPFPDGLDRSAVLSQQEGHHTRGEDLQDRVEGLHPAVYESPGMLSEMFNFGHNPGGPNPSAPPELLDYRRAVSGLGQDWYESREGAHPQRQTIGDQQHQHQHQHEHQLGGINAHNSAAAMQLFLTNPPPRSPSPPQPPPQENIEATGGGGFHPIGAGVVHHPLSTTSNNQFFWGGPSHHQHHQIHNNPSELSGMVENQGLSLSLSSSLQHFEAAKQAGESHIMFFNQHQGGSANIRPSSSTNDASSSTHFFKNLSTQTPQQGQQPIMLHNLQPVGGFTSPNSSSIGFGSVVTSSPSLGVVNVLRNSKYAKPAQELLEEFCSVGRGHQLHKPKLKSHNSSNNQKPTMSGGCGGSGGGAVGSSSSTKDPPQVSPVDRIEHQRRKIKLLAMLDEVDRRYNHYCEQMQMVVNSFDVVMGYSAAVPYTALAQKAMSRHFRCLKDAIHEQLKISCEVLGEKDPTASSGLTKGETPRLKMLEQSLRQQRAFHQMGMMDQEMWRPQRGLPERSVNILRAWLFEHFLHPYPSDADKHLLARQTGLSRNQVSNWFINARVRLWKPMVEDMYQQESKDNEDDNDKSENQTSSSTSNNNNNFSTTPRSQHSHHQQQQQQQQQQQPSAVAQNPMPSSSAAVPAPTLFTDTKISIDHHNATVHSTPPDCDPSLHATNTQNHPQYQHQSLSTPHADASGLPQVVSSQTFLRGMDDTYHFSADGSDSVGPATMIKFGQTAGDVSLTLGLRHAGNTPEDMLQHVVITRK